MHINVLIHVRATVAYIAPQTRINSPVRSISLQSDKSDKHNHESYFLVAATYI